MTALVTKSKTFEATSGWSFKLCSKDQKSGVLIISFRRGLDSLMHIAKPLIIKVALLWRTDESKLDIV